MEIDRPRNYSASNEELIKIALELPTSERELKMLSLEHIKLAQGGFKEKLLNICNGFKAQAE